MSYASRIKEEEEEGEGEEDEGMTMVSSHYNCTFVKSQFQFQYVVNLRSSELNR